MDLAHINQIHRYFVENTVVTFSTVPKTDEQVLSGYKSVISSGLPYIVATDGDSGAVLGFTYASSFRSSKSGYRHTVELSLFCHPEQTGKGIGTSLLKKLLDVLREPKLHPEYVGHARSEDEKVRQVIACMAIDDIGDKGGLRLKEFYQKFGFEEVGHLRKVGHKFDRWQVFVDAFGYLLISLTLCQDRYHVSSTFPLVIPVSRKTQPDLLGRTGTEHVPDIAFASDSDYILGRDIL
jgi:L-amino acid N-acyltransferase YncA